MKFIIAFVTFFVVCHAQIPSFGGCPEYEALAEFNKTRFLGMWYEQERYFTVSEVASRCVTVNYEMRPDGKLWVNNAYTNRITSVQRIVSGVVNGALKNQDGVLQVKYSSFPVNYDTTLKILDSDYDSFAVIYSCTRIGPIGHTESAWLFTREREPAGPTLQRAYGVLDRFKISRTFFVKSDQSSCETVAAPVEAEQTKEVEATKSAEPIEVPGIINLVEPKVGEVTKKEETEKKVEV